MIVREHRLPVLLERPLAEVGREIWCMGYSGTGNPLLPAALEAHVTYHPLNWLSVTTGRLSLAAAEVPGVEFQSMAGGSLVHLVQRKVSGGWSDEDRAYERLGYILGHYHGARPTDFELRLVNLLHAASVTVRNHENRGAGFVRDLAGVAVGEWSGLDSLHQLASEGEKLIRRSRGLLSELDPVRGGRLGPAIWIADSGALARGAHGKAVASRAYARQAAVALVERADRGFTKLWVVLPAHERSRWDEIMGVVAHFSSDFSYTGLRGAGAIAAEDIDSVVESLWGLLGGASSTK